MRAAPLAMTARACSRRSPSRQPPEMRPAYSPAALIRISAPGLRYVEPSVRTSTPRATARPAARSRSKSGSRGSRLASMCAPLCDMPHAGACRPSLRRHGRVSRVARPLFRPEIPVSMAKPDPWVVHKFGGSSVADADCFRKVAAILESAPEGRLGVVLSACRGVTDALLRLVALAERHDERVHAEIAQLRERHMAIATELLSEAAAQRYRVAFDSDCRDLQEVLRSLQLPRPSHRGVSDLVAGYGEIWSTRLFQRFFAERARRAGPTAWLDARRVVVVEWGPLGPGVQWPESRANIAAQVPAVFDGTLVITGFIAIDRRGVPTTLG